jgi:hypothetical protein
VKEYKIRMRIKKVQRPGKCCLSRFHVNTMQDQSVESGIVPENNKRSYSVTSGRNGKQPVCRINAKGLLVHCLAVGFRTPRATPYRQI